MKKTKGRIWIVLGLIFLAAALCLTAYNLYDGYRAEKSAGQAVDILKKSASADKPSDSTLNGETVIPDYILNPNMKMPGKVINGIEYIGMLRIPSINLELPVISKWNYSNLKNAPCRYSGSAYLDNLAIAGHNYSSHFGRLKSLSAGDEVSFTDIDGNRFDYEVALIEMLTPTDVDEVVKSEYDLSLFTCTLNGQSRVTIRCERIKN